MASSWIAKPAGGPSAPIEKESFRWLAGTGRLASVCPGAASIMLIADRERATFFKAFSFRPKGVELLVRLGTGEHASQSGSQPVFDLSA